MRKTLFIFILFILNSSLSIAQCAMCRGSVETNMSTGRNVIGNGLNGGILYLFAFPYLIVGVIAYMWYRSSKKAQLQKVMVQNRVREAMKNSGDF